MRFPNWVARVKSGAGSVALALALMCGVISGAALAADDATKSSAQSIIQQQEQAFAKDDAEKAYSFAAPNVQMMMRSAEGFMSMVKQGYAPVFRHRSFEFGESQGEGDIFVQKVRIIDDKGKPWDALYTLKQLEEGVWRITGCVLSEVGTDA